MSKRMKLGGDRHRWPLFVRMSLWRLPDRNAAWVFVWVSIVLAIGFIAYGFKFPLLFILGGAFFLTAVGYFFCIRWVDRHGRWY